MSLKSAAEFAAYLTGAVAAVLAGLFLAPAANLAQQVTAVALGLTAWNLIAIAVSLLRSLVDAWSFRCIQANRDIQVTITRKAKSGANQ